MARTITFNELRALKDKLPDGSIHQIAKELGLEIETVRNYFGGYNYKQGKSVGIHIEPGPNGGIVVLDDTTIFDKALSILGMKDYPEPVEEEVEEDSAE
ncbi:MAG: DNA-binding protein [Petrimonas sp.]|nr:DNA-binding protein [Petrimonas sp.]